MLSEGHRHTGAPAGAELLAGPAIVFASGTLLTNHGLLVKGDRIEAIEPFDSLLARMQSRTRTSGIAAADRLDLQGALVLPGFINAHAHLYSSLARGIALDTPPAQTFVEILERLWWKLDEALTLEDVRVSAQIGLAEALSCGVTTLLDHHSSPNACVGSLDVLRDAAREAGVRVGLAYEVSDRHGPAGTRAAIEENVRFARALRANPDPMTAAQFGLHALFTIGEETLSDSLAAARAENLPLHLHVSEDEADVRANLERHGARPVARLARHRALDSRAVLAHCVHIDASEIETLARTGAFVAHNPASNMNNAVGCAPVRALLAAGARVGLGTDGLGADMIAAARAAFLLERHAERDPRVGWEEGPHLLLTHPAVLASQLFGLPMGELRAGAAADFVALAYDPPTPLTEANLFAHLIHGIHPGHVWAVVAGGRVRLREGRIISMDVASLREGAREHARALWRRLSAAR